jgi:hypothetical protein
MNLLLGTVVRTRTHHEAVAETTGLLCSIDPLGAHVVLLQLAATSSSSSDRSHSSSKEVDDDFVRKVTMLHHKSFDMLEPVHPIPDEWVCYLRQHNEKQTKITQKTKTAGTYHQEEEEEEQQQQQKRAIRQRRREETVNLLKQHGMVLTSAPPTTTTTTLTPEDSIVALGGALKICGPLFDANSCTSSNPLILRRIRNLLISSEKEREPEHERGFNRSKPTATS